MSVPASQFSVQGDAPPFKPVQVRDTSRFANTDLVPEKSMTKEVQRQAKLNGVPPSIALAVASHMSGMRQEHVRPDGRVGLMGVDPQAVEAAGLDVTNWRQNVQVGVTQLAKAYGEHGNWKAAIGAVAGSGAVSGVVRRQRAIAKGSVLPSGSKGLLQVSPPLPGNPHVLQDMHDAHGGVDLAAQLGDSVTSITPGKVVAAGYTKDAGHSVTVRDPAGRLWSYAHLDERGVRPGDPVKAGEQLGAAGATGTATGPHVHISVRVNGKQGNPLLIIQQAYSGKKSVRVEDTDFDPPQKGGASAAGYPANPSQPATTTPTAQANAGLPPEVAQVPGIQAPHPVAAAMQDAASAVTASPETRNLAARMGVIAHG